MMDPIALMAEALRRRGVHIELIRECALEARRACQPPPPPPAPARIQRRQSSWVSSTEIARREDEAEQARLRRGSVAVKF